MMSVCPFRYLLAAVLVFTYIKADFDAAQGVTDVEVNPEELKCLVCKTVVEEMQRNISKIDSKKTIQMGGFRLDKDGNLIEKAVPYARSDIFLTELMDNICDKMDDYVRAVSKEDRQLKVIPLIQDGTMNPDVNKFDIVQDSDLNKSLKYYCQNILEEAEDEFIEEFKKENGKESTICTEVKFCPSSKTREEL